MTGDPPHPLGNGLRLLFEPRADFKPRPFTFPQELRAKAGSMTPMTQAQFDEWLEEYRRKKAEAWDRVVKYWDGLNWPPAVPMWNEAEPMKVSAWEGT